ncbi:MAG: hypothetical protein ACKPKO_33430 [Candidatus Fonsibacter sp.]
MHQDNGASHNKALCLGDKQIGGDKRENQNVAPEAHDQKGKSVTQPCTLSVDASTQTTVMELKRTPPLPPKLPQKVVHAQVQSLEKPQFKNPPAPQQLSIVPKREIRPISDTPCKNGAKQADIAPALVLINLAW